MTSVSVHAHLLIGEKMFCIADCQRDGAEQGWMAEHMLILGLESPGGKVTYMAAAFPSACGKTNLAMMVSALESQGYRVWTVGDDISWMKIGEDGYLHAINPEADFLAWPGHRNENQSERDGCAAQEHVIYERGDDFGAGAVVGRNWQRRAGGIDQLEGRSVGPVQRRGGASECTIHRAGAAVAKHFTEVGSARRRADFGVHFWRAKSTGGPTGVRIV